MRGEDLRTAVECVYGMETPPRAWGRHRSFPRDYDFTGNTPTCVGKTAASESRMVLDRKHPHVRGEDTVDNAIFECERETPPRAWGRLHLLPFHHQKRRNTPTCVGKTATLWRLKTAMKKHPHVRGEDCERLRMPRHIPETPPRAWGRHMDGDACLDDWRNTPTCVGKTAVRRWPRPPHRETPPRAWGRQCVI